MTADTATIGAQSRAKAALTTADTAPIEPRTLSEKLRLAGLRVKLLTLDRLDGRTTAAKRTAALIAALERDVGGDPTTAQRQLIVRAALTAAMLEDLEARWLQGAAIDPAVHATLSNRLRRLLVTIGLERVPKTVPSLAEYLKQLEHDGGPANNTTAEDESEDAVDVADEAAA